MKTLIGLRPLILLCLVFPIRKIHCQPSHMVSRTSQGELVARIPFVYDGVHIIIRATIDQHKEPLNFIFDTGAEVNVLNRSWTKVFRIKPTQAGDLSGSGNGMKLLPVTFFKMVKFGKAELVNQQFFLEDLKDLNSRREHIDGIIGYHLLASYIVKINFNDRVIDLYKAGRFDYGHDGLMMRMRMNNYTPVIRAAVAVHSGDTLTGWYQITTGGDYGVLFNFPYVEKYRLTSPEEFTGKDSVDDLIADRQFTDFKIQAFVIGTQLMKKVDASFCPDVNDNDPTRDIAGDIGNDVFRHFNIILNYGEREIFLTPNGLK